MRERAARLDVEPVNNVSLADYINAALVRVSPEEWAQMPWCPHPREHQRLVLSDEKQQQLKKELYESVVIRAEWQTASDVAPTSSQRRMNRHITQFSSRRVWVPDGCKADVEVCGQRHWRADYYHGSETVPLHRYLVASRESADMTKMHQDIRNLCAVARDAIARPTVSNAFAPYAPYWNPWAFGIRDAPTGIANNMGSWRGWRLRTDFTTRDEAVERAEEWKLPNTHLWTRLWAQRPAKKAGAEGRVRGFPMAPVGHHMRAPLPKNSRGTAVDPPLIPPKRGVKRDLPTSPPLQKNVAKARPSVAPALRSAHLPRWQYPARPVVKYPPSVPAPTQAPPRGE